MLKPSAAVAPTLVTRAIDQELLLRLGAITRRPPSALRIFCQIVLQLGCVSTNVATFQVLPSRRSFTADKKVSKRKKLLHIRCMKRARHTRLGPK